MEKDYQRKIIKALEKDGWFVIKVIRANKSGIPDITAVKNGNTIYIEAKGPKTPLSKVQDYTLSELRRHGANAFVAREGTDTISSVIKKANS